MESKAAKFMKRYNYLLGETEAAYHDATRRLGLSDSVSRILYLEPAGTKNKRVCLTQKGEYLARETAGKILRIENEIMESWPKEDVQKYLELTEAFLVAFREKIKEL